MLAVLLLRRLSVVFLADRPPGKSCISGDQACSALVCEIRPCPLNQHDDAIPKTDQKKDVHEQPRQPGEISGDMQLANLGNGGGASNGRKVPFIEIVEIRSRLLFQVASNGFRDRASL